MARDEVVVVVARREIEAALPAGTLPSGLIADTPCVEPLWRALERCWTTLPRSLAEEDPSHKQVIPYAVLRRGTELFAYRRLAGGGEARLRGLWSIGVGGHMNPDPGRPDASFADLLRGNLRRELEEEVRLRPFPAPLSPRFLGFVNHDETEVGRVHLGLLVLVEVADGTAAEAREPDKIEGGWCSADEVRAMGDRLEDWSVHALAALETGADVALPSLARPGGRT